MHSRNSDNFSYPILFLTMFLAVIAGNLASRWITADSAVAVLRDGLGNIDQSMRNLTVAVTRKFPMSQSQRRDSIQGRQLQEECESWTVSFRAGGGIAAREKMETSCFRFQNYVATGVADVR